MVGRNRAPVPPNYVDVPKDTSNELILVGTQYSRQYRQIVERQNEAVGLRLSYDLDAKDIFERSDHFQFAVRGIPAVRWTTGYHPDYHKPFDTIGRINFEKLEKIARLGYLSAREFADSDVVIEWPARLSRNK